MGLIVYTLTFDTVEEMKDAFDKGIQRVVNQIARSDFLIVAGDWNP